MHDTKLKLNRKDEKKSIAHFIKTIKSNVRYTSIQNYTTKCNN